jgi:hypothetical protein
LRFGAAQRAHVDVALTEAERRVLPVPVELAVDEPTEDLEELGAADIVEDCVQVPGSVRVLVDTGGAALTVAFEFLGGAERIGECLPGERSSFEGSLDERRAVRGNRTRPG